MSRFISIVLLAFSSTIFVSAKSCPTWFYHDSDSNKCVSICGSGFNDQKVEIEEGYCITSLAGEFYAGFCPYKFTQNTLNRIYSELPNDTALLNEMMCGPYNRKGMLCGNCIDGYGPAVYSIERKCVDCSKHSTGYAICLYLLLELMPVTLLFMCMTLFNLDITSGPLLGYFVFCQLITLNVERYPFFVSYILSDLSLPLQSLVLISLTMCQFWNLHWFSMYIITPFCISETFTGIDIQMLPLLTVVYPVILVIVTCVLMELHGRNYRFVSFLWKPFSVILTKMNIPVVSDNAVIQAFASLILLSYFTVFYTSSHLLAHSPIHTGDCSIFDSVLFSDPTVKWLGHKHIEYTLIVAVPFILLTLLPSFLFCIYPTRLYRHLSRFISARKRLAIRAFVEALHNCFKDGLNGTRDYRALVGVFALFPLLYISIRYIFSIFGFDAYIAVTFLLVCFSCVVAYVKPCKSPLANLSLSFHLMLLGIICLNVEFWFYETLYIKTKTLELTFVTILLTSHVLVLIWIGYRLIRHMNINTSVCRVSLIKIVQLCCHGRDTHAGYQVLN